MSREAAVKRQLSPAIVTEAAAWVARLHGPLRTPAVERGLREWLDENADHARAFELVTESWDEVGELKRGASIAVTVPSDTRTARPVHRRMHFALAASLSVALIAGAIYHFKAPDFSTGVGEQRLIALEDGTRVHLNTSTHIVIQYDEERRRIELRNGEAFFEVARNPARPFSVVAGNHETVALGTAFLVRTDSRGTAVTLTEGKVAIGQELLAPGDRVTFVGENGAGTLDRPSVSMLTAWQRGKVPIEDMTLADAVVEMNRYNTRPLVIERPAAQELRVSGIFRIGDSLGFAGAVARNYGLKVEESSRRIVLKGAPRLSK